jgi:hypothetical protein
LAKKSTSSERQGTLATENARLKHLLAGQAEELDILKKRRSVSQKTKSDALLIYPCASL